MKTLFSSNKQTCNTLTNNDKSEIWRAISYIVGRNVEDECFPCLVRNIWGDPPVGTLPHDVDDHWFVKCCFVYVLMVLKSCTHIHAHTHARINAYMCVHTVTIRFLLISTEQVSVTVFFFLSLQQATNGERFGVLLLLFGAVCYLTQNWWLIVLNDDRKYYYVASI